MGYSGAGSVFTADSAANKRPNHRKRLFMVPLG